MFVKCVEFKGIVGISVILATPFKISPLNRPMLSTTSITDYKITLTLIPSIRVEDTTLTSPTKIQIPLLTTPHKITLLIFNTMPLNVNLHNLHLESVIWRTWWRDSFQLKVRQMRLFVSSWANSMPSLRACSHTKRWWRLNWLKLPNKWANYLHLSGTFRANWDLLN